MNTSPWTGRCWKPARVAKSFKKVDGGTAPPVDDAGNPTVDFHGEQRSNATHASTTDGDEIGSRRELKRFSRKWTEERPRRWTMRVPPQWTFTESSGATRRTPPPLMAMRCWRARDRKS